MSTKTMAPSASTPKSHKISKSKDSSTKKSSKKRQRLDEEEEQQRQLDQQLQAETTQADDLPPSPSKRQRTAEPDTKPPISNNYTPSEADLETHSPFLSTTTSFYLPLSPISHAFPLEGLCAEHISPLLLTYYPPLRGVLLSYTNPRLSNTPSSAPSSRADDAAAPVLARSIDEYAVSYTWLTIDATILRPGKGCVVEGYVTLQNESYLGLVCWNFFNAGIDRARLPKDWAWVGEGNTGSANGASDWMRGGAEAAGAVAAVEDEGQGYFVDGLGKKVEGMVRFRVRDFESAASSERERGFLSIEGTLLNEEEDKAVDAELKARSKGKGKGRKVGRMNGTGQNEPL